MLKGGKGEKTPLRLLLVYYSCTYYECTTTVHYEAVLYSTAVVYVYMIKRAKAVTAGIHSISRRKYAVSIQNAPPLAASSSGLNTGRFLHVGSILALAINDLCCLPRSSSMPWQRGGFAVGLWSHGRHVFAVASLKPLHFPLETEQISFRGF